VIVAVVGIAHGHDLLPYYLHHYRGLGVERFVIACSPELQRTLSSQPDVEAVDLPRGFLRSRLVGMIEEELRVRHNCADDWLIPADLDELNEYPASLTDLVTQIRHEGATHVEGVLRDRIASDGALAELQPFECGQSIWDQYPLEGTVSARIADSRIDKVLLSRGDLGWGIGHHRMRDAPGLRAFSARGVAHHFKWRATLVPNLDWRVENEARAGVPWKDESVRLSEYFRTHGRICLDDVDARAGWRPVAPSAPRTSHGSSSP
jgi:hypothetical protein